MKDKKGIGQWGEDLAVNFLLKKSYTILERNWRFSRAEIDIIAQHEDILVFFEVKTRSSDFYGKPEDFISTTQQKLIVDAASQYMRQNDYEWAFRFDIVSILRQKEVHPIIQHFEDAFFPGIEGL
jgi:putative endonuclease